MDLSTVNNAVADASAGLPSGWTQFVAENIRSPIGQQAIVSAAANLGITDPSVIAGLVNQATGLNVTPQQVTQVAQVSQTAQPAPVLRTPPELQNIPPSQDAVLPNPTPTQPNSFQPQAIQSVSPRAPASARVATPADSGTSLSNITASTQNQPFVSSNPGTPGTSYGQASSDMVTAAAKANPELANALQNGTAQYQTGPDGDFLVDTKTGQQIPGNYTVSSTPSGGIALNIPGANGSMIQAVSNVGNNGMIAPLTSSNVFNVGVNAGAGGFGGGPDAFMSTAGPVLATAFPAVAPYILAYNSASAANKGQYGLALINALGSAGVYAAQNPNSQIGQMVNGAIDAVKSSLPQSVQDALSSSTTPSTPSGTSQVGNTTGLGNTDYSIAPSGSTGPGLNVQQGTGTNLFDTTGVNPNTGLTNGLGLQAPGSANLSSMGGGQGLTIPAGATANTPAGVLGANGVTGTGTGGLPINPSTGQTLGSNLSTLNTGVTTPSTAITNASGNVVGTPAGQNTSTGVLPAAGTAASSLLTPTNVLAGSALLNTLGTLNTNKSIANAANTQLAAGTNVQDYIKNLYEQQGIFQAPYQTAGTQAANTLSSTPTQDYLTHQFNATDLNAQLAPNYAFQLQQGQNANRNAANMGGGLLSGNTLQGLNTYSQNYAQGAYQNAFNNYQTQRQNIYSNLAGQAGIGQTANQQLSGLGGSLANTYGNVTTGLAASQAGAQTAQAVNTSNLLSNLGNTALTASLLKPA